MTATSAAAGDDAAPHGAADPVVAAEQLLAAIESSFAADVDAGLPEWVPHALTQLESAVAVAALARADLEQLAVTVRAIRNIVQQRLCQLGQQRSTAAEDKAALPQQRAAHIAYGLHAGPSGPPRSTTAPT